ncbi:hypothetical protein F5Y15DRAFT_403077 [Xylariaceae sp. FL0016]|nr:hypothetical protein F5Y15DRAFT_403077 [Xylariaceae sp. FL0016]
MCSWGGWLAVGHGTFFCPLSLGLGRHARECTDRYMRSGSRLRTEEASGGSDMRSCVIPNADAPVHRAAGR